MKYKLEAKENHAYKIVILVLVMLLTMPRTVSAQIKKITDNKFPQFERNYYQKENVQDTIIIVIRRHQLNLTYKEFGSMVAGRLLIEKQFLRSYPGTLSEVRFYHNPGPTTGHEEFLIEKSKINKERIKVIEEIYKSSTFWYHHDTKMFEQTIILVEAEDWESDKEEVKGIQVAIFTTAIE